MHIDRSGDQTRGFLPIYGLKQSQYGPVPLLAHPLNWDKYAQQEDSFLQAENDRLLYVAATRACSQLVVTDWEGKQGSWDFFDSGSADFEPLEVPEKIESKKVAETTLDLRDANAAVTATTERWRQACEPTYDVVAAKAYALPKGAKPHGTGEHGVEWGTVIHTLLEAAMVKPGSNLRSLAVSDAGGSRAGVDTRRFCFEHRRYRHEIRPLESCPSQQEVSSGSAVHDALARRYSGNGYARRD